MAQCIGIKTNGLRCSVMVIGDAQYTRCGTHMGTLNRVGPNQIRRDEIGYIHARLKTQILIDSAAAIRLVVNDEAEYQRLMRLREAARREEDLRFHTELHALEAIITRETEENGGINADQPFIERRAMRRVARRLVQINGRQQREERLQRWAIRNNLDQHAILQAAADDGLQALANDRQNVHTSVVVQKVKETVQKVLQIPVPPEYQTDTLKTAGEIVLECGLTKQAAWQMMAKYCADEDIYELGYGIYARVLNSVWQYIKSSPDSTDLKKILKAEMQDNIGMCAQGNLSRLCNILSGYMEGLIVDTKSKNEIIGERLSALMEIQNADERESAGRRVLEELNVPAEERDTWMQSLIDV
jgi:hypothetical protein